MTANMGLEIAAARLALDAFGVPADAVVDFVKHRENHVYRVRTPDWDRSLRMHRVGYRTDDELRSETASVNAFHAGGIAVPIPVAAADGAHVVAIIDASGSRRQATMQKWIADGRTLGDTAAIFTGAARPSDVELRHLGALIARMHNVAAGGAPVGYTRRTWDAAGLAGPAALWGSATRLTSLTDADRNVLERADARLEVDLSEALPRPPTATGSSTPTSRSKTCSSPTTVWSRWTSTTPARAGSCSTSRPPPFGAHATRTVPR